MTPVTRNLLFQRRQKRRVRCMAWCLAMSQAGAVGRSVPWNAGRSAGVQSWQDCAAMRSRTLAGGKMLAECVPQRSTVARCCRSVFSGCQPWQYFAVVHPRALADDRNVLPGVRQWQDIAAMRFRAAIRGSFFASCVPEGASDGKSASSWQHIAAMHPK